ncbi:MAG TPA: DNA primase [Thermomicrobiales bacterium]|nr:DNA primase [Thermomicrobiales bacterium]
MASDNVAEVRDRTDIADLVGQYVDLKRTGRSYKGLCPFHQEKTPSFVVFPDSGNFHCFGCGRGGDAFTFYMDVEHVDFREALQELARRAGVELAHVPTAAPEEDARRRRLIEINELATVFFSHALHSRSAGELGRRVLEERGVSPEMIQRFRLGYAPDGWDNLLGFLKGRDVDPALQLEAGLVSERDSGGYYDRFRNRLMFPISNRNGEIVGFGARAIGDGQPKYLNSPQSAIFDKSALVYGLDLAKDEIRKRDQAVIVEGYMDVIAAHQFSHSNVVATMGTALTEPQVSQISRASHHLVLALDADTAGQMATLRGIETMREALDHESVPVPDARGIVHFERRLKAEISIVRLPEGKDPDDLIRQNPDRWPELVARAKPFLDFMVETLTAGIDPGNAKAKSEAMAQLAPVLQGVPDRVVQAHHIANIARRLHLDERVVRAEIRRPMPRDRATRPDTLAGASTRLTTEDHLVALLLRHRASTTNVLERVQDEDLLDARNRDLVRLLREPDLTGLDVTQIIAGLEDDLANHAEHLVAAIDSDPGHLPAHAAREASQALENLGRERFGALMRHLQASIGDAEASGEHETVAGLSAQLASLYERHRRFYPAPSPYFRDIRDSTVTR